MRTRTLTGLIVTCLALAASGGVRADIPPYPHPNPGPPHPPIVCAPVLVMSVESAHLLRREAVFLTAQGTASTAGWRNVVLVFRGVTGTQGRDATAVYDFMGCRPEVAAEVLTPISASTRFSPGVNGVRHILVKAATNSVTVDVDALGSHP